MKLQAKKEKEAENALIVKLIKWRSELGDVRDKLIRPLQDALKANPALPAASSREDCLKAAQDFVEAHQRIVDDLKETRKALEAQHDSLWTVHSGRHYNWDGLYRESIGAKDDMWLQIGLQDIFKDQAIENFQPIDNNEYEFPVDLKTLAIQSEMFKLAVDTDKERVLWYKGLSLTRPLESLDPEVKIDQWDRWTLFPGHFDGKFVAAFVSKETREKYETERKRHDSDRFEKEAPEREARIKRDKEIHSGIYRASRRAQ
ncbi:hypothetical protein CJU89_5301 [Yarrowia sp. B02]|nr:hypothetical protein CJU89_5301 [Yarrowia sp. B02]